MRYLILIYALCSAAWVNAQTLTGRVLNAHNEPLEGAAIQWLGTDQGATSDEDGMFGISLKNIGARVLIVSYLGYRPDTVVVDEATFVNIILEPSAILDEVVIEGRRQGIIISNLQPVKTEQITQTELEKAACCDLAGCFDTQSSVQAHTTNILTNAKELRILGLSGVYNQVLINGFPAIRGLTYTYGISSVPGTLVENIFVSKGANSVLQGFESISGQINVELKDPAHTDRLLLNGYINSFMEKQVNAQVAFAGKGWSNLLAVHTVQPADKTDRDGDGFLDLPLLTRYMILNQWSYRNAREHGWSSDFALRFVNERRIGGQASFDPVSGKGDTQAYGQTVEFDQPEVYARATYRFDDRHGIVMHASALHHRQTSFYGTTGYRGNQTLVYGDLRYEFDYGDAHDLKAGLSFRYQDVDEEIALMTNPQMKSYAGNYRQMERIPGVFAENILRLFDGKVTWIAGIRADMHNRFGTTVTPRTLIKYDIGPRTVVRANAGTGWRTVNLFSENVNLLASARDVQIAGTLLPERAFNTGINVTQKFEGENLEGHVSMDYYRTDFQNQIFPDYDVDPALAIIDNFKGKSISDGFQAEVYLRFHDRIEFKAGYNYLDVYRVEDSDRNSLPFIPRHKLLTTLSYKPLSNRWHADMNIHWYGTQRLPDTRSNPIAYRRPDRSDAYAQVNAQFTYNLSRLAIYAGCENIFDFRQEEPIIGWQDPFGRYFDTSLIWGPVRGRELYLGVRFRVE